MSELEGRVAEREQASAALRHLIALVTKKGLLRPEDLRLAGVPESYIPPANQHG